MAARVTVPIEITRHQQPHLLFEIQSWQIDLLSANATYLGRCATTASPGNECSTALDSPTTTPPGQATWHPGTFAP